MVRLTIPPPSPHLHASQADIPGGKPPSTKVPGPHAGVFVFNTQTHEWRQPAVVGNGLDLRYGHSMAAVGPHGLLFGGWEGNRPKNDVIQLDASAYVE